MIADNVLVMFCKIHLSWKSKASYNIQAHDQYLCNLPEFIQPSQKTQNDDAI